MSNNNYNQRTPWRFTRLLCCLMVCLGLWTTNVDAQVAYIVTPTGGTAGNTDGSGADPICRFFNSIRYQVVYTSAELSAAGIPSGGVISKLAWNVTTSSVSLANYTIKMGHTTATNSAAHNVDATTTVKNAFTYAVATGYNDITFDNNFTWDGSSNIVIEICTGITNPFTSPYGGVQAKTGLTSASRSYRVDGSSACGVATSSALTTKPYVRLTATAGSPCAGTPTPGNTLANATASSISTCSGSVVALTLQNSTSGTGVTYDWQSSSNLGGPYVSTGATNSTYSPTVSSTTYYQCVVTCSAGPSSGTSTPVAVNTINCSFDVAKTSTSFSSISGTGTSMSGWRNGTTNTDDNMSTSQPIGFAFNYKGVSYSNFSASTNGFLTFNTGTAATGSGTGAYGYSNPAFTTSGGTGSILTLAPFYEDLVTQGNPSSLAGLNAAIKYQLTGSSPNRVATIEWVGFETFGNAGPNLNFQVKLFETSGVIEFVYGTMELFNGTSDYGYSYTMGVNGATMGASPTVVELQSQQINNVQNFSNVAANALNRYMDCNTKYTFTPGTYSGGSSAPSLTNDAPATPVSLSVNGSPCTSYCGTYYTSLNATASGGITVCNAGTPGTPDDDVWFTFPASTSSQTITVRGGGGYNPVVQLFSDAGITSLYCVNATGAGLTETINATGLTPSATYYVRVYHSGTGSSQTPTGGAATAASAMPDFSICVNEVIPPPTNDNICSATNLVTGSSCTPTNSELPSTLVATASPQTVCTGTADDDVWYKFTALTSADLVTVTSGSGYNAVLQVFSSSDQTCTGTLTSLGCINNTSTGGVETFSGTLTVGNTYFIRVYHFAAGAATGNFSICVTASAPSCVASPTSPTNGGSACNTSPVTLSWPAVSGATMYDVYFDAGSPATTLVSANQTGTTYAAGTLSNGLYSWKIVPKNGVGSAVSCSDFTFTVVAPASAGTASGPAALFTAVAGSYSETGGSGGTLQWKSSTVSGGPYTNISGATTNPANISFATPGTYYVVLVRSISGCTDAVSNEVTTVVTVYGDYPCSAIPLVIGTNGPYSNSGATGDAGEVVPPGTGCNVQTGWCNNTGTINSIWGTFTAPASGRVTILSPSFDTQLALYSAEDCGSYETYTLIAANDDGGSAHGGVSFSSWIDAICLSPGSTYYVLLDGYNGTTGSTTIVITDAGNVAPSFGATCPSDITVNVDPGLCTASVSWTPPTATDADNCFAPLTLGNSHNPGDAFPIGTTVVSYTANDGYNATVTCSFNVTVNYTPSTAPASISSDDLLNDLEICSGDAINLTQVGGSLGSGNAAYAWYTGSCGGTPAGSGNSINVAPTSTTTYFVRAEGCNTTACASVTITVKTSGPGGTVQNVVVPASGCTGNTVSVSVPVIPNTTYYNWSGPAGTTFNGMASPAKLTTNAPTVVLGAPLSSGWSICVQGENACGVTVNTKCSFIRGTVSQPGAISGSAIACLSTSGSYTIAAVAGADLYEWTMTGDATVSGTGTTGSVTFGPAFTSGTLCVRAKLTCGTASAYRCMTISSSTAQPAAITGSSTACPSSSSVYSIPAVAGATSYNWTVSCAGGSASGTGTSATITFPASFSSCVVCVTANSVCGVPSASRCKTVSNGTPGTPSSITGVLNGVCNTGQNYSCPSVAGATGYTWSIGGGIGSISYGQGTNGITVNWNGSGTSGTLSVVATNGCGNSGARTVNIRLVPGVNSGITGDASVACNSAGNYTVGAAAGATGYNWSILPAGPNVIPSGNSALIDFNAQLSGNYTVYATSFNGCGNGNTQTFAVNHASCARVAHDLATGSQLEVSAYPNPAHSLVTVNFNSSNDNNYTVKLVDLSSRVVYNTTGKSLKGNNVIDIDLSSLAKGVYMLQLNNGSEQSMIKLAVE